jgi:3D (Asp-Asp-Asp) domain-containing protein
MLLITSLILLLSLRSVSTLTAEVQEVQQEIEETKQEVLEARELALESEQYETQLMKITKYAPLSPGAVRGRDYSGDPSLTASGEKLVPGETAAAGPNLPFGTRIYVENEGWYTVQDRGSAIGPNNIDLACVTTDESIEFGEQQRLVIIELP